MKDYYIPFQSTTLAKWFCEFAKEQLGMLAFTNCVDGKVWFNENVNDVNAAYELWLEEYDRVFPREVKE